MGKTIPYEKKIGGHGEQLLFTQDLRSKLRAKKIAAISVNQFFPCETTIGQNIL